MNAPANVLVCFTDRKDAAFDGLSYLENEFSNHGIAATLRALDDGEVDGMQRGAALLAALRDAVRLMPLGTKERGEWLQRASAALTGTPEALTNPSISTGHLSRPTLDMLEREGETVSLEPKWKALMPIMLAALENGTDAGKANARRSLTDLAAKVDAAHAMHKRMRAALDTLAKAWPKVVGPTEPEESALIEAAELIALTAPRPPDSRAAGSELSAKLDDATREYVESVLSNDEAASDEELIQLFIKESSVSLDDATAIVARRMDFLNFMPTKEQPRLAW
jgi:hypothetical protein